MRRATWIVWLMLALLPLRGWAVAGMGVPTSLPMPGPAAMAEAGEHRAMPPCHQAGDDGVSESGTTCQSCDACHGALATPPVVAFVAAPPRAAAPPVVEHRDTGRMAVAGLERPPRSDLA